MKTMSCLVVLTSACGLSAAHAQSAVTLYGIVDNGFAWTNSVAPSIGARGASRLSMATGFGSGNRWGLYGKENLGAGTSAIFRIENGFSATSGAALQGGRMFGRQALVGLTSASWGTATMGRQYDFTFDYVGGPFLSWSQFGSIYGAHVGDVDNTFQTFRLNNSIKYETAQMNGLKLGALYAFSNQAGTGGGTGFANNRAWGLGVSYTSGALRLGASVLQLNNPSAGIAGATNPGGAIGGEYGGSTNLFYNAGFVERQRVYALGAGYSLGAATVNAALTDTHLDYRGESSLRVDNFEINGKYQLTPALLMGLAYIYTQGSGYTGRGANAFATGSHPKWHQVNAGVNYLLSKRTDLHLSAVYQRSAGDASAVALNAFGPAGTGRTAQLALAGGLRHRF